MNNTCPSCGAVYNVASKDIGRRIKCKKCGSALTVTDAGLELDSVPPAEVEPAGGEEAPRRGRSRSTSYDTGSNAYQEFGGLPTVLFAFGAFLSILCLFMPIIDQAKVRTRVADYRQQQMEYTRADEQSAKDGKTIEEKVLKGRETRLKDLQESIDKARISQDQQLWTQWGMMFGFVLLMTGSIGYLMPGQSGARRVVGAIVLCAQLVFIIFEFVLVSGVMSFASPPSARGGP